MSEIKALGKLRGELQICTNVKARPTIAFMEDIADEIQAEVDERFMELPVDADGVPIRVGDTVEWLVKNGDYEVVAVGELVALKLGEDGSFTIAADALRHVKPRTLEDVLRDLEGMRGNYADYEDVVCRAAKYAAEIRELLGVDA